MADDLESQFPDNESFNRTMEEADKFLDLLLRCWIFIPRDDFITLTDEMTDFTDRLNGEERIQFQNLGTFDARTVSFGIPLFYQNLGWVLHNYEQQGIDADHLVEFFQNKNLESVTEVKDSWSKSKEGENND